MLSCKRQGKMNSLINVSPFNIRIRSLPLFDQIVPTFILQLYQIQGIKRWNISLIMCEVHKVGKRGETGVVLDPLRQGFHFIKPSQLEPVQKNCFLFPHPQRRPERWVARQPHTEVWGALKLTQLTSPSSPQLCQSKPFYEAVGLKKNRCKM